MNSFFRKTYIAMGLIGLFAASSRGAIIAQWNFDSYSISPSTGNGKLTLIGGVSGALVSGVSGDDVALNTSVYPAQSTGNKNAGVQFSVSTSGKRNIMVGWYQRVSPTASKYSRLLYTTNGVFFMDFPTPTVMYSEDLFEFESCDLGEVPGVSDNPNFAFKLLTEFESTAIGDSNARYVTVSGTAYYTVGTVRFDLVTVKGDPILPFLVSPQFTTNGFQFTVTGASTSNYVVQSSAALQGWTSLQTNTAPFLFTDAGAYPQRFHRAVAAPN